ncbi:MAG: ThiF family adenylyltransferase [Deltaproteobacteria bacterium]|nr:MAG: ThiF family adenylyltransferase [Deltaproteobacteria bacterium]
MAERNDEQLSRLLKQFIDRTGEVSQGIDALVADQAIPKRIAESLACDLNFLPQRYARNQGTLGCEGQRQLLRTKVLVAGLGGLGGYVLEQLCRCGIGVVVGVDADHFDETNLNRQLLADLNSIGISKTEVARRRVTEINDAVEFYPFACKVEDLTGRDYEDVALIFDCLDLIPSKLHLQDMGERLQIPLIHGAIGGWYGQVAVVWPASQLLTTIYGARTEGIERELGNPPFTPAFVASLMVSEGIKVLLQKNRKEDSMLFVDLLTNQLERVNF